MIYCASSLSLASLELFVHLSIEAHDREFVWFEALVPKGVRVDRFGTLPDRWDVVPVRETSQRAGSRWLLSMHSAVLQVPSAITPGEFNFLLNPRHPEFGEIAISEPAPYVFDARIWKSAR